MWLGYCVRSKFAVILQRFSSRPFFHAVVLEILATWLVTQKLALLTNSSEKLIMPDNEKFGVTLTGPLVIHIA